MKKENLRNTEEKYEEEKLKTQKGNKKNEK